MLAWGTDVIMTQMCQQFTKCFKEIKDTMAHTYLTFANDPEEIQAEWLKYTNKVDKRLEEALRTTVKKSLQELSRALNGDNKTEVTPIFNVILVLEKNNRVELRPTVQDLFNMIHNVSRELITVVSHVPRVAEQKEGASQQSSFYETISNDEDTTLKTIVSITQGVSSIVDKVQACLANWERKYKHIWDQDKEAYIRRYDKAKKPLSAFDTDISKYKELSEDVVSTAPTTRAHIPYSMSFRIRYELPHKTGMLVTYEKPHKREIVSGACF